MRGREEFRADDARAGKETRPEESHNRAKQQDLPRATCECINRHHQAAAKQIDEKCGPTAETIGHKAKADVAREHARQVRNTRNDSGAELREAAAALFERQGEIRRNPGKQAPPGEEAEEVQQQQNERVAEVCAVELTDPSEEQELGACVLLIVRGISKSFAAPTFGIQGRNCESRG